MIWAFAIEAEQLPDGRILVSGKAPVLEEDLQNERDPHYRYLTSVRTRFGQKGSGLLSPHVRFANASSDQDLLEFVREFGPVAATEIAEVDPERNVEASLEELTGERTLIGAYEDLSRLRNERRIYAAALSLLGELKRGEDKSQRDSIRTHISEIADGIMSWPEQWRREKRWREVHAAGPIPWHFDSDCRDSIWRMKFAADWERPAAPRREDYPDSESYGRGVLKDSIARAMRLTPYQAGGQALCTLMNSFPTDIKYVGDHPVETLPFTALKFGIRPSLYLILREVCFGQSGTNICLNDRCNRFFVSQREGNVFCSRECSQKYRQRVYWANGGSRKRKRRRAVQQAKQKRNRPTRRRRKIERPTFTNEQLIEAAEASPRIVS
jgi:hypothetical protein